MNTTTREDIMEMLRKLERLLTSEIENGSKSTRTADEYLNVAKKLVNGDFSDENIPSKSRYLQISAVLSYMKDYDLISENETFGLHMKALKKRFKKGKNHNTQVREIEQKVLTDAQFKNFLERLPTTHKGRELKLACEMSRYSGMRMSEVLTLTPEQIQIKADAVYISIIGKRNKPRTVFLPLDFAPVLQTFVRFTITQNYVTCTVRRVSNDLGLANFSFHALRHTYATELSQNGVDLGTLADILGHDDPKTTMIYRHVNRDCPQQLLNLWKRA